MKNSISGKKPKDNEGATADRVNVSLPKPSSYKSDQTIGTTAVPFAFASGAIGLSIKVTHATENIRVGQGSTQTEADTDAASATPIDKADGIVEIGRSGSGAVFYSLLGSVASVTCNVGQLG